MRPRRGRTEAVRVSRADWSVYETEKAEGGILFCTAVADRALANFNYITYSTPNKAARALITDDDIRNSEIAFPDSEILNRCETFRYLGEEAEAMYLNKWNQRGNK